MRPDILVRYEGAPALVADCKYKRTEPEAYKNHDYYQVLSYCVVTRVERGILLYPFDGVATDDTVQVRNTGIAIEQMTINLALPFVSFRNECRQIAERILSVATTAVPQVA
jgi:5-methylcytosine-specific restriction endonuclease McrBC regulatory subunit McrC